MLKGIIRPLETHVQSGSIARKRKTARPLSPENPRRLIVNADDYGRTRGVSRGIRQAHRRGIVTTTTAMMNMPGVQDDLRQAHRACPRMGLGVHLVLTAGCPLRPPDRVPSLVTRAGDFPDVKDLPALFGRLNARDLRDEWRAQIETFLEIGLPLDHLDSHHHASYLSEAVLEVMLALAEEYAAPIRHPFGPSAMHSPLVKEMDQALVASIRGFAPRLLAAHPVKHPHDMIASFFGPGATLDNLAQILERLPRGDSELMCHPGYADAELRAGSGYNLQREQELAALTDGRVRAVVQRRDIELITFAGL